MIGIVVLYDWYNLLLLAVSTLKEAVKINISHVVSCLK